MSGAGAAIHKLAGTTAFLYVCAVGLPLAASNPVPWLSPSHLLLPTCPPGALMAARPAEAVIPQAGLAGDMRISYAKFLELLAARRVKRVVVYGDMKTAVVEVPHPWTASMTGAPGTYPFIDGPDGRPVRIMTPNPLAPDDPT